MVPGGSDDLNFVLFMLDRSISGAAACYVMYNPSARLLWLANDAGNSWLIPATAGASASVSNSQCLVNAAGFSYSTAGVNVTLNFALTFTASFQGSRNLYVMAVSRSGLSSGWQTMGAWTPAAVGTPSILSVTPNSGAGSAQIFSVLANDPAGANDVNVIFLLVNSALSATGGCYVMYSPSAQQIWLANDTGTAWLASIRAGAAGTLSNSQCAVDAAAFAYIPDGLKATAVFSLSFKSAFSGVKNLYAMVSGRSGLDSGWRTAGTWTAR
jgi:hypothetical protein